MAGLTSEGFIAKRVDEIRTDLSVGMKQPPPSGLGAGCSTGEDSPIGAIIGVTAIGIGELWEAAQALYDSFNPDTATGTSLDNLCALTGVRRKNALPSTGEVTFHGDPAVAIASGTLCRVPSGPIFETTEAATTDGAGDATVPVACVEDGPTEADAATITALVSIIAGITSVTNAAAVAVGRNIETDDELRARREASLSIAGAGPDGAIRTALLAVDEVIDASVISNRTLVTDANGIPGKSFRAIVWSGSTPLASDEDILRTIWERMPAGIYPDGDVVGTLTDAQGFSQTIRFSRATEKPVYLICNIAVDESFPLDGDDLVAAALLAEGQGLRIGEDVVVIRFVVAAYHACPGIIGIVVKAGFTSDPQEESVLTIAVGEIATFSAPNISVTA